MKRELYRDEQGIFRYRCPAPKKMSPGTPRLWYRSDGLTGGYIPVTVVEDRGAWVIVMAEDGRHRVKRHNLSKP